MAERKGVMLAYSFDERRFERMPKPIIIQPKLEGDRLRVLLDGGVKHMYSSSEKERTSLPHIKKDLEYQRHWGNLELDGEAFRLGMRHSDIRSRVSRTVNLHENCEDIEYHVYDIVEEGVRQIERLSLLRVLFEASKFKHVKMVESRFVNTLDELEDAYEEWLDQGYEGIILRNPHGLYKRQRSTDLVKLKPRLSDSFKIIGFEEEYSIHGKPKGTLGAIVLTNDEGEKFKVGTGPTQEQRQLIWFNQEVLIGQFCKIRFQAFTKARGVPKMQSVDKEWLMTVERILKGGA